MTHSNSLPHDLVDRALRRSDIDDAADPDIVHVAADFREWLVRRILAGYAATTDPTMLTWLVGQLHASVVDRPEIGSAAWFRWRGMTEDLYELSQQSDWSPSAGPPIWSLGQPT